MTSPIIEAEGVTKRFGKVRALDGLDLVAHSGQVVAVLGPNGAGKTTFVRSLATLLRPDGGTLRIAGMDVGRHPAEVRRLIGLAGQYAAVEETMTGRENLQMVARLFGHGRGAARSAADTVLVAWGLAITTAIGFAVGFRIHGSVVEALAAFGLTVVFGFAFIWLFVCMGLAAGNAQAAQGMSLLVFPLTFVSSAYVPVDSMPGWMQPIAENQPLTMMTNAVRALALGGADAANLSQSTSHYVVASLLWSVGIVLAFAPLAVARYRRS